MTLEMLRLRLVDVYNEWIVKTEMPISRNVRRKFYKLWKAPHEIQ